MFLILKTVFCRFTLRNHLYYWSVVLLSQANDPLQLEKSSPGPLFTQILTFLQLSGTHQTSLCQIHSPNWQKSHRWRIKANCFLLGQQLNWQSEAFARSQSWGKGGHQTIEPGTTKREKKTRTLLGSNKLRVQSSHQPARPGWSATKAYNQSQFHFRELQQSKQGTPETISSAAACLISEPVGAALILILPFSTQ